MKVIPVKEWIDLIKALVPLSWPLILGIVLWRLFPSVKAIVNSRSFSVKVAGMEVSVQDATHQLSTRIDDLQNQVIALRKGGMAESRLDVSMPVAEAAHEHAPAMMWVDDKPDNNAFEIAQLEEWGVQVYPCLSTKDAMETLHNNPGISAVISDMGRREGGLYHSKAGIVLLKAMRRAGFETPLLVYSTAKYAAQNRGLVIAAGGSGATSSQIELLEWLRQQLGLASA